MNKKLIYTLLFSLAYAGNMEVASSVYTPIETLVSLSQDRDEDVRSAVAKNTNTPIEILVSLSKDRDEDVRSAVAENTKTPPDILVAFLSDKEEDVVANALGNKNIPIANVLPFLTHEEEDFREAVAKHPGLPTESMNILLNDKDESIRVSLASNPSATTNILTTLASDKEEDVIVAVAKNPKTPNAILEKLSQNDDYKEYVAENSGVNPKILDKLSDSTNSIRTRMIVSKNSNLSVETMNKIVADTSHDAMFLKAALARNPKAPAQILEKLSTNDDYSFVRGATLVGVALNPNTSADVLDKLGSDKNDVVRAFVYKNPKTPKSRLDILAQDGAIERYNDFNKDTGMDRSLLRDGMGSNTRDTMILLGRPDIARNMDVINVKI